MKLLMKLFPVLCALALIGCATKGGIPILSISRVAFYAAGDLDVVYNVDLATDATLTNWVFVTNFIGNGTNNPPEFIGLVGANETKMFRVNPE